MWHTNDLCRCSGDLADFVLFCTFCCICTTLRLFAYVVMSTPVIFFFKNIIHNFFVKKMNNLFCFYFCRWSRYRLKRYAGGGCSSGCMQLTGTLLASCSVSLIGLFCKALLSLVGLICRSLVDRKSARFLLSVSYRSLCRSLL
jgi:hypothetical protein